MKVTCLITHDELVRREYRLCQSLSALSLSALDNICVRRHWTVQCAHGEVNAIFRPRFAHQTAYMGLDSSLLDA
jgi:hypothetical protein